jgi:hypothetical protein
MLFFGLMSLLMPVLGLALIAWAAVTIIRAITLPRGSKRESACEACRYPAAGLESFTCPECGNDLRTTGIITPAMEISRRGTLVGAILAWTILCGIIAYMVFILSFMFVGFNSAMANMNTTNTITLSPTSGNYQSIDLAYDTDYVSVTSPMVMTLVTSDGTSSTLTLDPGPRTVNRLGVGTSPWDKDAVETWYQQLGLDTTDKQVVADADEITRVVDSLLMNPGNPYTLNLTEHPNPSINAIGGPGATAMSGGIFGSAATDLIVFMLALLIYIGGIIFITVRRSRIRRLTAA